MTVIASESCLPKSVSFLFRFMETNPMGDAAPTITSPMPRLIGAPRKMAAAGITALVRTQIVINSSARSATPAT